MQAFNSFLLAHASHLESLLTLIGNWHFLILHFPIALLITTGIAEFLNYLRPNPLYDQGARFALILAVVFVIPTVLFGFILSTSGDYPPTPLLLHKVFGSLTLLLTVFALYFRENDRNSWLYPITLALAIISVSITGYFGGLMSFGETGLPF